MRLNGANRTLRVLNKWAACVTIREDRPRPPFTALQETFRTMISLETCPYHPVIIWADLNHLTCVVTLCCHCNLRSSAYSVTKHLVFMSEPAVFCLALHQEVWSCRTCGRSVISSTSPVLCSAICIIDEHILQSKPFIRRSESSSLQPNFMIDPWGLSDSWRLQQLDSAIFFHHSFSLCDTSDLQTFFDIPVSPSACLLGAPVSAERHWNMNSQHWPTKASLRIEYNFMDGEMALTNNQSFISTAPGDFSNVQIGTSDEKAREKKVKLVITPWNYPPSFCCLFYLYLSINKVLDWTPGLLVLSELHGVFQLKLFRWKWSLASAACRLQCSGERVESLLHGRSL